MNGSTLLDRLGVTLPVLAAPMAGGPTTPALVLAAAEAGSLGFLATGYQQPQAFADQVASVAAETDAFGVNLFAPHPVVVDPQAYAAYRDALRPLAERLGVELPEHPVEDDDHWRDKIDVVVAAAPPLVSFTFGLPDPASVTALRRAGSLLAQTVTTVGESRGLMRVQLEHAVGNLASCKVAVAAGFVLEGTARSAYAVPDDGREDCHIHGRLPTDPAP
jgi:nitronate monooxygenase